MIAVNQLAHGVLGQQTHMLGATITSDPDLNAEPQQTGRATTSPRASKPSHKPAVRTAPSAGSGQGDGGWGGPGQGGSLSGGPSPGGSPSGGPSPGPTPSSSGSSGGTWLNSAGGSVLAECQGANAYLLAWTPAQGFGVDDVRRGPALTASVTFTNGPSSEVQMQVSCNGGVPVAHVSSG
jgi:eukaryotic-like serine/threonine-protein kinase